MPVSKLQYLRLTPNQVFQSGSAGAVFAVEESIFLGKNYEPFHIADLLCVQKCYIT